VALDDAATNAPEVAGAVRGQPRRGIEETAMGEDRAGHLEDRDVVISVRQLWKVYDPGEQAARDALARGECLEDQTVALRDVSLDVRRGELLVVMGLSGSGKSTLVRCLNGLVTPTAGNVRVLDVELPDDGTPGLRRLRPRLGMIFQAFALLPHRTVLSNVGFGLELRKMSARERDERAAKTLELVGLSGREDSYPEELSGGQQQRVGLARALTLDPDILLMDEPFSALDALIREDLRREILELQGRLQKTIVLITHDLDDAVALADRIAVVHDGRLLQVGTPAEICLAPAGDVVERFVQHVDRLSVVRVEQAIDSQAKERPVVNVAASAPLGEAVRLLGEPDVDSVLALGADGHEVGVVTASSAMRAMAAPPTAKLIEERT
jgi:glycine betaine/proline transport system ATP-binding protein